MRVHLSGADGLTQLTGDAALLSIGVAAEGVLSPEARGQGALLKRVVDGGWFTEQVTHSHRQTCRYEQNPKIGRSFGIF